MVPVPQSQHRAHWGKPVAQKTPALAGDLWHLGRQSRWSEPRLPASARSQPNRSADVSPKASPPADPRSHQWSACAACPKSVVQLAGATRRPPGPARAPGWPVDGTVQHIHPCGPEPLARAPETGFLQATRAAGPRSAAESAWRSARHIARSVVGRRGRTVGADSHRSQ